MESQFNTKDHMSTRASTLQSSLQEILASNPMLNGHKEAEAWLFRDDIGSPGGVKGYEEQINSVGMHHGHCHWPSDKTWNTYNS